MALSACTGLSAQRVERNIILPGRRHVTTTTGFADAADPVANLVAEFVREPKAATATP